jgi:4-methylaminobutanoate oxidase (formaldehyde-forming)
VLRRLADGVVAQLPIFRELRVREHRGGLPTMTADGHHIVGPVPGVRGFYVASGCCVGGLTIAPAIGAVLADWIVTGQAPVDMTLMAPARFAGADLPDDRLKEECFWRYAHHYSTR